MTPKQEDSQPIPSAAVPKHDIVDPKLDNTELRPIKEEPKHKEIGIKGEVKESEQKLEDVKLEILEPKQEVVEPDSSTTDEPEPGNKFLKFCKLPVTPGKTNVPVATVTPQRADHQKQVHVCVHSKN